MADNDKPGRFESPLEDYPGYVQLPAPLMLAQFREYWAVAVKPLADIAPIDWEYWQGPLDGVIGLIVDYGDWGIKGVAIGDVKAGNIPLSVAEWLLTVGREYISPQLDPKKRRVVSTII